MPENVILSMYQAILPSVDSIIKSLLIFNWLTLNNNNAEIESYYEEDGVVYVCLYGKSSGLSDLTISAEGKTKFNDDTQTFSSIATISVDYTDSGVDVFNIVLWVLFIGFCAGIIIYLLISVVKARRNDVR